MQHNKDQFVYVIPIFQQPWICWNVDLSIIIHISHGCIQLKQPQMRLRECSKTNLSFLFWQRAFLETGIELPMELSQHIQKEQQKVASDPGSNMWRRPNSQITSNWSKTLAGKRIERRHVFVEDEADRRRTWRPWFGAASGTGGARGSRRRTGAPWLSIHRASTSSTMAAATRMGARLPVASSPPRWRGRHAGLHVL